MALIQAHYSARPLLREEALHHLLELGDVSVDLGDVSVDGRDGAPCVGLHHCSCSLRRVIDAPLVVVPAFGLLKGCRKPRFNPPLVDRG